jgi:RNA polymerase subunit RPABC4/transcription elongation factor Spt4
MMKICEHCDDQMEHHEEIWICGNCQNCYYCGKINTKDAHICVDCGKDTLEPYTEFDKKY